MTMENMRPFGFSVAVHTHRHTHVFSGSPHTDFKCGMEETEDDLFSPLSLFLSHRFDTAHVHMTTNVADDESQFFFLKTNSHLEKK